MFRPRRGLTQEPHVPLPRDEALAAAAIPRVDFLIVGAMKCGTTTVRRVLSEHADVHIPERELHFFGNHRRYLSVWRHGRLDAQALETAYGRHYRGVDRPLVGGKTPNYMASSLTLERLHRFHPDAKILVMLRDPVERARSHWEHLLRQVESGRLPPHRVAPSLAEHLLRDGLELERSQTPDVEVSGFNILWRGFYATQIRRIRHFYPEDRIFVGVLDDLRDDRERFFRGLFEFLGLRWDAAAAAPDAHETDSAGGRRRRLTERERDALREAYAESIRDLEGLLGRELPWKAPR